MKLLNAIELVDETVAIDIECFEDLVNWFARDIVVNGPGDHSEIFVAVLEETDDLSE